MAIDNATFALVTSAMVQRFEDVADGLPPEAARDALAAALARHVARTIASVHGGRATATFVVSVDETRYTVRVARSE